LVNLSDLPSFNPSESPDQFDVVVVGSGAAGLYAALCLPESLQVGLITKDQLKISASDWAQGGMAAAVAPDDSPKLHIADTLKAGAGLCELPAVKFLAEHGKECVESLVKLGVQFDRQNKDLALTLEAAHSRRRVLHASDTTGRAVVSTLTEQVLKRPNIKIFSPAFVLHLWLKKQGTPDNPSQASSTPICQGVCLVYQGKIHYCRANAVVLATGGGGQVFAQTTNPKVSTGDGVAIAWRAGALLRDLEFFQFHPTALTKPGAPRFLISEAVRGEGAHLVDDQGRRFVFDYHPSGELAPRDVVSRAIFNHLQHSGDDPATAHVWLDLRPIPVEKIRYRFPNIIRVCQKWGIDLFNEPIPVAPAAHYWMGGIMTDLNCATSIPGLYAVGETSSTGVQGANRLASNSLLECIVFGAQLAKLKPNPIVNEPLKLKESATMADLGDWPSQQAKIEQLRQELPRLVWQSAGICRGQANLEEAIAQVRTWQTEFAALPMTQYLTNLTPSLAISLPFSDADSVIRQWGETRNLLDIAYLILTSAAFRTESRGGHYRSDFPHANPKWQVHTMVQKNTWWKSDLVTASDPS
jgi:L-aspartate oxidase